ncbi:MAG: preprotein translocase subunit YajC [Phycisphaerales bacterium]|nr:preprotein translocase subunit YajC [Phycisphaerales bacterium]
MTNDFEFDAMPSTLILAVQEGLPPGAGKADASATTATVGADGTPAPAAPASGMSSMFNIVMFGVIGIMIFSMFFGGRKEKKKRAAMLSSLKRHDRVRMAGGLIGSVVEVKPDIVVVKIDENSNVRATFTRGAVEAVLAEATPSTNDDSTKAD